MPGVCVLPGWQKYGGSSEGARPLRVSRESAVGRSLSHARIAELHQGGRLTADVIFGGSPGNDLDRSRAAVLGPYPPSQPHGTTALALVLGEGANRCGQSVNGKPRLRDGLGPCSQSEDAPAPEKLVSEIGREDGRRLAGSQPLRRGARLTLVHHRGHPREQPIVRGTLDLDDARACPPRGGADLRRGAKARRGDRQHKDLEERLAALEDALERGHGGLKDRLRRLEREAE